VHNATNADDLQLRRPVADSSPSAHEAMSSGSGSRSARLGPRGFEEIPVREAGTAELDWEVLPTDLWRNNLVC